VQSLPVVPLFTRGSIYSSTATGTEQITEANKSNKHLNWPEADQLAIYKRGRGFELGADYREQIQLSARAGLEFGASAL